MSADHWFALAGAAAVTAATIETQFSFMGIEPIVWFCAFAGSLFAASQADPKSWLSRPVTTILAFAVGIAGSTFIDENMKLSQWAHALIACGIASFPVFFLEQVKEVLKDVIRSAASRLDRKDDK